MLINNDEFEVLYQPDSTLTRLRSDFQDVLNVPRDHLILSKMILKITKLMSILV